MHSCSFEKDNQIDLCIYNWKVFMNLLKTGALDYTVVLSVYDLRLNEVWVDQLTQDASALPLV